MRRSKVEVYLHIVWATHQRLPMVTPGIERDLYRVIEAAAKQCGCKVLAMGGMPDHVHVVVKLPATVSIAGLLQHMKVSSSTYARNHVDDGECFNWHAGYAALSVTRSHLERVVAYVQGQKQHHIDGSLHPLWEEVDEAAPV